MVDHTSRALFRFSIVSQVIARMHRGEQRAQAVHTVAAQRHEHFDGAPRRVSPRSIYRWLEAYEKLGTSGLEPIPTSSRRSAALPEKLVDFLVHARAWR